MRPLTGAVFRSLCHKLKWCLMVWDDHDTTTYPFPPLTTKVHQSNSQRGISVSCSALTDWDGCHFSGMLVVLSYRHCREVQNSASLFHSRMYFRLNIVLISACRLDKSNQTDDSSLLNSERQINPIESEGIIKMTSWEDETFFTVASGRILPLITEWKILNKSWIEPCWLWKWVMWKTWPRPFKSLLLQQVSQMSSKVDTRVSGPDGERSLGLWPKVNRKSFSFQTAHRFQKLIPQVSSTEIQAGKQLTPPRSPGQLGD